MGYNSIKNLSEILLNLKSKNIFIVCGKNSFEKSGVKKKISTILDNYLVTFFSDFTSNPKFEDILLGLNKFKLSNADTIIAVGGGSSLDVAKSISFFSNNSSVEPKTLLLDSSKAKPTRHIDLIVIPTTAGSGSEATHFAVVYFEGEKYSLAHTSMIPSYAIIDPQFLLSLSNKQLTISGLDALSQAIESYWAVDATEESREYAKSALLLMWNNLKLAVIEKDKFSLEAISKGSYLAGKAINISKTTGPHALSYYLTSNYDIPHGLAVALFIPYFIRYNYDVTESDCLHPRGPSYVKNSIKEISSFLGFSSVNNFFDNLDDFLSVFCLDGLFKQNKISVKKLKIILHEVNIQRAKNNPRLIVSENLIKYF